MKFLNIFLTLLFLLLVAPGARSQDAPIIVISIDVQAERRPNNPLIYGTANADAERLALLFSPLNRSGGNNTSRYNWQANADNRAGDWFFQSIGAESAVPGERADAFIAGAKAVNAEPMLTIPLLDWIAKIGPNREKLASFSVAKYGAQQKTDEWMPDAGNGIKPDGSPVEGNDPSDANIRNSPAFQQEFVRHLVEKWGLAKDGGLKYYILDNEPAIWHSTHRDVQPIGLTTQELVDKTIAYSDAIKAVDPGALVLGPEEWGWTGFLYSGHDSQFSAKAGWNPDAFPDRKQRGGMEALPWYLDQLRRHKEKTGKQVLDVFTVHFYPQGGEFGNDVSPEMQLRRNRSTRLLWDADYLDDTWIADKVQLIPRLKKWVSLYYPGLSIGLTEYNWGAEDHINGATTQADILGIFGREGLDMAARWSTPDAKSPTFKAMQMYRNYDGKKSTFGETSVRAEAPDADKISAFAAVREADGALTVMVINKQFAEGDAMDAGVKTSPITFDIKNFPFGSAQMWQLTANNKIQRLPDAIFDEGKLHKVLPHQSVTLFVFAPEAK